MAFNYQLSQRMSTFDKQFSRVFLSSLDVRELEILLNGIEQLKNKVKSELTIAKSDSRRN